jgi:hypothetical protein
LTVFVKAVVLDSMERLTIAGVDAPGGEPI